jgi:hypothetical protein
MLESRFMLRGSSSWGLIWWSGGMEIDDERQLEIIGLREKKKKSA